MLSNDVRNLLHTAVPTAAAGVVAVVVSGVVSGGKGVVGGVAGALVVVLFMGIGLVVLQRTAKTLPHLFQMMGLLLYTTQLLVLVILLAVFKNTSLFNPKAFALTVVATTIVWVACQARAFMTAKTLYVEPESSKSAEAEKTGLTK